jgi:transposase
MKPIPPKSVRAVAHHSGPKGRADLRIREWRCVECGTFHENRDVNPALNILALGHERLAVGIPSFRSGGCQKKNS